MDTQSGKYVGLHYIAPRKRKHSCLGFVAENIPQALMQAQEYVKENGGRYIAGFVKDCQREWINGAWLSLVPLYSVSENLDDYVIQTLNQGGL